MTKQSHIVRQLLSLALCLACLISIVPAVSAEPQPVEEQPVQEETAKTTLTTLVRKYAYYSSYNLIGQMENGAALTVLGESSGFYKVDCFDMTGYIAKEQVELRDDGKYYVNCNSEHADTQVLTYTNHAEALLLRHAIVALAQEQLGKPYVFGAIGPYSFDCSGLTNFLYAKNGITLTRCADTQLADGVVVAKEGLQPGDLVFFREPWSPDLASHIGVYVGNNKIIHSGSKGVGYADLDGDWFADYYLCARRVIWTETTELPVSGVFSGVVSSGVSGRTAN